jgi:nucleoid DNA-binding protein
MNKLALAIAIAAHTGLNKTTTYAALIALTQQLEAEGFAGRAVVWDNFGTFWPRRVMGQRTGRSLDGSTLTYDNYKLIANPAQVAEASFVQGAADRTDGDIHPTLMALILQSYKALVMQALRRGRSVYSHGHGGFKVGKVKARVNHHRDGTVSSKSPGRLVVRYHGGKQGPHQKFVGLAGLMGR